MKNKSSKLSFYGALVLSFKNYRQRFWRNILISLATSIGLVGIFVALSLGNGINQNLQRELDSGAIPSQVQVSINNKKVNTSSLSAGDQTEIEKLLGKENISYFEFPFAGMLAEINIDGMGSLNLEEQLPAYSQVVSLYENSSIKVSSNTPEEVLAGPLYHDKNQEKGITLPQSFLVEYNKNNQLNLTAQDIVGRPVKLKFTQATPESTQYHEYDTIVSRVINDELEESNSFMSPVELRKVLESADFSISLPYAIVQLNDPKLVKDSVTKLNESGRYVGLSQIVFLDTVMNFVKIIQAVLAVFSLQAVVVSIVMIGVVIFINIQERTREIGILKAVGYDNGSVRRIFIWEALYLMGFAYLFSLLVSLGLQGGVNSLLEEHLPSFGSVYETSPAIILGILVFSLLAGWLAAFIPTRRISRMDPVDSLRSE